MNQEELLPHLFRTEYRNIVAVLSRRFGLDQIEIAEDIASETFLTAAQSWGVSGTPTTPVAWLYKVAKHKAVNYLHRDQLFKNKIAPQWIDAGHDFVSDEVDIDLSTKNIVDSQLQMMFALCHPSIPLESQIGLALRILCGFGIEEIADAFLTNKETINKRLHRAKEKLNAVNISLEMPSSDQLKARLDGVLHLIYLLFNEGYFSQSVNTILRKDLCLEAMRLCIMLLENKSTQQPKVNALMALMCFHSSRFDARIDHQGALLLYDKQDASSWNQELIQKVMIFLHRAAEGEELSKYHLEAGIAYWHTQQKDSIEKWEHIVDYYDQILRLEYSPVVILNRLYAISKRDGKQIAILAAEQLNAVEHPYLDLLLGELYSNVDNAKAREFFQRALSHTYRHGEMDIIQQKIAALLPGID